MALYVALIEIPDIDLELVDALRERAHPRLHVTIEAPSKRSAAEQLAASTVGHAWNFSQFTAEWWFERLHVVASKTEAARLRDWIAS